MTTLNQGRNEIRFNNSGGRCLLENWVEERAVKTIDPKTKDLNAETTSSAQLFKAGHTGLLSTDLDARAENRSTFRDSYCPPVKPGVRQRGKKEEILERMFYEKASKEVHEEFNPPPEPVDFKSLTHKDFNIEDFVSIKPAPTAAHDYIHEQPVTFWTEHKDKVHSVSQIKTLDSPFRKNASFSKPIDEYWNEPQPFEHENVPNM